MRSFFLKIALGKHQLQLSSVENERSNAGRDGQTRLARLNSQASERGQVKHQFSCSADHKQGWQTANPVG